MRRLQQLFLMLTLVISGLLVSSAAQAQNYSMPHTGWNPQPSQWYWNGAIFDPQDYLNRYSDLRAAFGNNIQAAANHWMTTGMNEGRQGTFDFNIQEYFAMYSDVAQFCQNNYQCGYNHFVTHGLSEGRRGLAELRTEVFNLNFYIQHNPDVFNAYHGDPASTVQHWLNFGCHEGRVASATFNVHDYLNRYVDLQAAFGSDYDAALRHYIFGGIREGRDGR